MVTVLDGDLYYVRLEGDRCARHMVTQGRCSRVATTVRRTSKGVLVPLCTKCDTVFGRVVGLEVILEKVA